MLEVAKNFWAGVIWLKEITEEHKRILGSADFSKTGKTTLALMLFA